MICFRGPTPNTLPANPVPPSRVPILSQLDNYSRGSQSYQETEETTYNSPCIRENCVYCGSENTKAAQRPRVTPLSVDHQNVQGPLALPISNGEKQYKISIAILCALPLESDAVEGQLNEYCQTGSLPTQKVASDIKVRGGRQLQG